MPQDHARKKTHPQKADSDPTGRRSEILSAFRTTFTSSTGAECLTILRASTGHGKPSFLPPPGGGALDPYAAAFRDGRKSVIDEIDAYLAHPEDESKAEPKATGKPA